MQSTSKTTERVDLRKVSAFVASLILPALIVIFQPLDLSVSQSTVLAGSALAITWWVGKIVDRTITSVVLLVIFSILSGAEVRRVFSFPLSGNFVVIVLAFIFSQGISKSNLASTLLKPLLVRYVNRPITLLLAMIISAFAFIFLIPQPFSRVIILAVIFSEYFDSLDFSKSLKEKLLYGVFAFSVIVNMLFIRGDIILNNALLVMGNTPMTEAAWVSYMFVPTLFMLALVVMVFLVMARSDLKTMPVAVPENTTGGWSLSRTDKRNAALIGVVILLWATEELHGVGGVWTVAVGTIVMFAFGLLKLEDLRSVNPPLLVFLTSIFAIGSVMTDSGTAGVLFVHLERIMPSTFSIGYVLAIIAVVMGCHMVFGSNITTLSVVVPGLLSVSAGIIPSVPLVLTIYIAVCSHYLLPLHHVIILIGSGENYYTDRTVIRFGLVTTPVIVGSILLFYLSWWRIIGIL